MTLPSWTVKLAAAAVIPVLLGVGVAMSAPSQFVPTSLVSPPAAVEDVVTDGSFGVDMASITGPTKSEVGNARACDDPSWPIVPFSCRDFTVGESGRN